MVPGPYHFAQPPPRVADTRRMSLHTIYAGRVARRPGPPRPVPFTPPVEVAPPAPAPPLAPDGALLAILDAAPAYGETIEAAFRRKEQQLLEAFAALSAEASRSLHARLCASAPDDAVAVRFARLVRDRRERLLAFLGDARRREALAASKGGRRG
jgi:hypothetical protein